MPKQHVFKRACQCLRKAAEQVLELFEKVLYNAPHISLLGNHKDGGIEEESYGRGQILRCQSCSAGRF